MMKGYFYKQTRIDKNSNLSTSNDKELINLTDKKNIKHKSTLSHLMDNTKKGSGFMKIFGEGTTNDQAKTEFNWIMNQLIINNININDLSYQTVGIK